MKTRKLFLASVALTVFSLAIIIFQLSCSKPSDAQPSASCLGPQPKLQFKANGILYNCDALLNKNIGWMNFPYFTHTIRGFRLYALNGEWNDLGEDYGSFGNFPANQYTTFFNPEFNLGQNISVGTVNVTKGDYFFEKNGMTIGSYESNKNALSFVITASADGLASGTFSGSLESGTTYPKSNITEGVFSNVPIF